MKLAANRWTAVAATTVALALVAVLVLAAPGSGPGSDRGPAKAYAKATSTRTAAEKAIWGPVAMPDGSSAFPVYKQLKVDVFQVQLNWAQTAASRPADPTNPDDPAYRWPKLVDTAVADAGGQGIQVAIMVRGTPGWANGGKDASWAPD